MKFRVREIANQFPDNNLEIIAAEDHRVAFVY